MRVTHDPDIGRCDDCGSEEGRRVRQVRVIVGFDGEREQVDAWPCTPCRRAYRPTTWPAPSLVDGPDGFGLGGLAS